ncbi:MAG TPA: c-type cytochrome domain-containing protein [Planctomycetaceae bacterium]|nr:c-type cytochrome domain-containing protein [Planctomycetaceae bacterium]
MRLFPHTDGGPPHPQPLSRKGRGEKIFARRDFVRPAPTPRLFPPSPLAGEGLGVRGALGASARVMHGHLVAGLCAVLALSLPARGGEPPKRPEAIVPAAVALSRPVDFEKDVYPILEANCLACHNVGIAESKLNIETVEGIRKGGKRGPAVVAKKPDDSLLFQFASRGKQPAMPPLPNKVEANALTPQQLGILKQWILEGARGGAGTGGDSIAWQTIPPELKAIFAVALSPDGGRFVAAGRANQVVVYDVPTGREVDRLIDPVLSDIRLDGRLMYPGGAADRDLIHALAFSTDGTLLAAAGYRSVKLWKRPHFLQTQNATLAEAPTALAVSQDGTLVAIAMADHSVVLGRTDGAELRKLAGSKSTIAALEFAPDGKTLYAASLDRTLRAWNIADGSVGAVVTLSEPAGALAISKDGTLLITGHADGMIRVWSTHPGASSKPVRKWKAHEKPITSLAVVLPAGEKLASGSEDGTVRIWQLASARQIAKLDCPGPVTALAVRPDGQVVAAAVGNRVLLESFGGAPIAEIHGSLAAERRVAELSDDTVITGQHVAAAAARVAATGQEIKERQEALKKTAEAQSAAEKTLADFTAKKKAAADACAAATKASQGRAKDAALKKKADEAEKSLAAIDQSQMNAANAAQSAARSHEAAKKGLAAVEVKLKDQQTQKTELEAVSAAAVKALAAAKADAAKRQLPVRSIAFSADGSQLAVAGDDPEIQLYDARTGRPLEVLTGHAAKVACLAFGKGSTLVSAGTDKQLIAWETNPRWTFAGRIGPKPDAPLELGASALAGRVLCLAFNHDGTLLATGGGEPSRSGELKTWRIPSLTLDREFKEAHSDTIYGVDFSRDGKYLASCAADKFVKIFETRTGKQVRSLEGHAHQVLAVSWKADGSLLASAGADNQIKVWNLETGEQQRSIASHSKQVTSIQFIGTSFNIVSASGDKTVRLHQAVDGDNFRTLEGATDYLYSATATADESVIAAGGEDGVLRLWNGTTGKSLATFPPPKPDKDSVQASAAKH